MEEVNVQCFYMVSGSCSPLMGINAKYASIGMCFYEDATIGDDTAAGDTNDDLIKMIDDVDTNDIGDGGLSDAEGNKYNCVLSFKDGMKEVKRECLYYNAGELRGE